MFNMSTERENRAADMVMTVDPRSAEHNTTFLLQMLKQSFTCDIGIDSGRRVAEGDNGKIRRRAGFDVWQFCKATMEIAGKGQLFLLRGAKCCNTGQLQRKP